MRRSVILCAALVSCSAAFGQTHSAVSAPPDQFEIGRHTFVDNGPPLDYYELFVVRPTISGTSVERITLTPPVDSCTRQAKVEVASASINDSIAKLLGSTNPCAIPEKDLRRELKRCEKCVVFSGADVAMQVNCGDQTRVIRSDILDKDMFDPAATTPKNTQWTMQLLRHLDEALGPGVLDRPIFHLDEPGQAAKKDSDSSNLESLSSGKYDALFLGAPDKPSELYHAAQNLPPLPSIQLVSSVPVAPKAFAAPNYPPIAKLARVEGSVSFTIVVDPTGSVTNLSFQSGPPLLYGVVKKASSDWRFPEDSSPHEIHAVISFSLNCLPPPK